MGRTAFLHEKGSVDVRAILEEFLSLALKKRGERKMSRGFRDLM